VCRECSSPQTGRAGHWTLAFGVGSFEFGDEQKRQKEEKEPQLQMHKLQHLQLLQLRPKHLQQLCPSLSAQTAPFNANLGRLCASSAVQRRLGPNLRCLWPLVPVATCSLPSQANWRATSVANCAPRE